MENTNIQYKNMRYIPRRASINTDNSAYFDRKVISKLKKIKVIKGRPNKGVDNK